MKFSYSRADCFNKCPFQYKLRYLDGLKADSESEASDPLIVGTAVHDAIEIGVDAAIKKYHSKFYISDDSHVAEEIKIRAIVPKVKLPPNGIFELKLQDGDRFVGFIDYAAPVEGNPGLYDLYDFKYTNPKNAQRYRDSSQLQVYAYYFEKLGFGRVRDLFYVIVPKTMIRQKKTETIVQYRKRLNETLKDMKPTFVHVPNDRTKVCQYFENVVAATTATDFPKNQTNLCDWCDYQTYCESDGKDTSMILPKNERRDISKRDFIKIWVYGEPFTGKTVFADQFPNPIMLNTDGNIKNVTAPYISLSDHVESEGRLTKTIFGWETLKESISDLEKGNHTFETVVLDLVEDAFEMNRSWVYDKRGWEHESDDSFRAWDIVRKNFYDVMRRLTNLPMNVVLISHEDSTRDFTKRSGDKVSSIKPNLQDKVAKKIAGMVDIVGRTVVRGDDYILTFKTDEFIFGGGRLNLDESEIELSFDAFAELVGLNQSEPHEPEVLEETPEKESPKEEIPEKTQTRARRTRKRAETAEIDAETVSECEDTQEDEKPVKRTRKRRTIEE